VYGRSPERVRIFSLPLANCRKDRSRPAGNARFRPASFEVLHHGIHRIEAVLEGHAGDRDALVLQRAAVVREQEVEVTVLAVRYD
jgi:hypothetical protein